MKRKPKQKTFEVVAVRLPDYAIKAATKLAKDQGVERGALLRELICLGLGVPVPETREGFQKKA